MYRNVVKLEAFKEMVDSFSLEISDARKNIEIRKSKYDKTDCEVLCRRNDILKERNEKLKKNVAEMINNAKLHRVN